MMTRKEHVRPIQNMGLIDRTIRWLIGGTMLVIAVLGWETRESWVPAAAMAALTLGSLYPVFTAIMGWDPFYALASVRSCNDSGRNQCGSFPYEVKAMLGRAPGYCDSDVDRSLESCHVEPVERPRHGMWHVDDKTMDYPTRQQIKEHLDRTSGGPHDDREPQRRKQA